MTAEECRNGLRSFASHHVLALALSQFTLEEQEHIIMHMMRDTGAVVTQEAWIGYCKRAARIIRLAHFVSATEKTRHVISL